MLMKYRFNTIIFRFVMYAGLIAGFAARPECAAATASEVGEADRLDASVGKHSVALGGRFMPVITKDFFIGDYDFYWGDSIMSSGVPGWGIRVAYEHRFSRHWAFGAGFDAQFFYVPYTRWSDDFRHGSTMLSLPLSIKGILPLGKGPVELFAVYSFAPGLLVFSEGFQGNGYAGDFTTIYKYGFTLTAGELVIGTAFRVSRHAGIFVETGANAGILFPPDPSTNILLLTVFLNLGVSYTF